MTIAESDPSRAYDFISLDDETISVFINVEVKLPKDHYYTLTKTTANESIVVAVDEGPFDTEEQAIIAATEHAKRMLNDESKRLL